jgi:hypothetical protein
MPSAFLTLLKSNFPRVQVSSSVDLLIYCFDMEENLLEKNIYQVHRRFSVSKPSLRSASTRQWDDR